MSTYNRRYISMDESTKVANEEELFLEDTQIKLLKEFKINLEKFNYKFFKGKSFLNGDKLNAYNQLNDLITLLDKLLNTHNERSNSKYDNDLEFEYSKFPLKKSLYNLYEILITDINTIIKNREKGDESTTSLCKYISDNKIIELLLALFKTQTRIPPSQDEIKEHIAAQRQAEINEARNRVLEEEKYRQELRGQVVKGLEEVEKRKKEQAQQEGGKKSKKLPKKEILGKMRCIYKIPGDRKEYLKHKGKLITVKEYKELMKAKPKKKEAKPKKVKKTKSKK